MSAERIIPFSAAMRSNEEPRSGHAQGEPLLPGPVMAIILGITDRRLRQLCVEGMPRSARGLYPLTACVQWYLSYWKSRDITRMNDLKRRRLELQISILEFKVGELTGRLVSKQECVDVWSASFRRLGNSLEQLAFSLGREFGWTIEEQQALCARLDEAREAFTSDSNEFIQTAPSGANADHGPRGPRDSAGVPE